jgi:transcriptional antiterminator NusG
MSEENKENLSTPEPSEGEVQATPDAPEAVSGDTPRETKPDEEENSAEAVTVSPEQSDSEQAEAEQADSQDQGASEPAAAQPAAESSDAESPEAKSPDAVAAVFAASGPTEEELQTSTDEQPAEAASAEEESPAASESPEAVPAEGDTAEVDAGAETPADESPAVADADAEPADGVVAAASEDSAETADEEEAEPQPVYDEDSPKKWFIIHTYSGFENKVAESLRTRAEAFDFTDKLGQILIPTEEVVEMKNGKKVTSKRLLYPGYVLLEIEMNDDLWHAVKSTPRVTGFVGGGPKPVPLTADEVNSVLYRQTTAAERPRPKLSFEKNETVRIIDGPFSNFSGKVDEINAERNTLRVMVTIFGRSTPVELDFLQVEKLS